MKFLKAMIFAIIALFLMQFAIGANTGLIVSYPNGTTKNICAYASDGWY